MVAEPADTAPDVRLARRRDRFEGQRWLWAHSTRKRGRHCGRTATAGTVGLRVSDSGDGRHAGFAGVQTCGSVWACPVCSAKVASARQGEVEAFVMAGQFRGLVPALFTFTVRHDADDTIETVWDGVQAAHHAMTSGRAWVDERDEWGIPDGDVVTVCEVACCGQRYSCEVACCGQDTLRGRRHAAVCKAGRLTARAARHAGVCRLGKHERSILPWVRVVEGTVGANGWHIHEHLVVLLPAGTDDAGMQRLYWSMQERWATGARAAGLDSLGVNVPVLVESATAVAEYVTKDPERTAAQRAGLEVARGDLKSARSSSGRTAWQLLADARDGDEHAARLFAAWEVGSEGRRQMTWAGGVRDMFGLGAEATDDELAAVETGTADDELLVLDGRDYARRIAGPGYRADVLEAAENSPAAVVLLLDTLGVRYIRAGFVERCG